MPCKPLRGAFVFDERKEAVKVLATALGELITRYYERGQVRTEYSEESAYSRPQPQTWPQRTPSHGPRENTCTATSSESNALETS